ncbi:hypothetical protein LJC58_09980 [Lachnospiraceae bacterium OttesenSCG-928-D06]|nr:hypothetical protein [Lachnospiraceae bacterium OttesenSCG-928-D06]
MLVNREQEIYKGAFQKNKTAYFEIRSLDGDFINIVINEDVQERFLEEEFKEYLFKK